MKRFSKSGVNARDEYRSVVPWGRIVRVALKAIATAGGLVVMAGNAPSHFLAA